MSVVLSYIEGLKTLFFPHICLCCQSETPLKGDEFCVRCLTDLPVTTHFQIAENDFVEKFYGRVPLEFGAAWLNFYSGSVIKDMLHALKYRRKKDVGLYCGKQMGIQLRDCEFFNKPDLIIPIPIHYKKRYKRGYNQAELIARGISEELHIPLDLKLLIKTTDTKTQTKKNRKERTTDLKETLEVVNPNGLKDLHILLVDDVMTTGATFEAAALELQQIEGVRFSMVSLAITKSH
jgi:ComF family protein